MKKVYFIISLFIILFINKSIANDTRNLKIDNRNLDEHFVDKYIDSTATPIIYSGTIGGNIAWGDYDNDGDLDYITIGKSDPTTPFTALYKNNGNFNFTLETTWTSFEQLESGNASWGDYDNDGNLDILMYGMVGSSSKIYVYKNVGNSCFINQPPPNIPTLNYGKAIWSDLDNDGYLDIVYTGTRNLSKCYTKIYKNNAGSSFTEIINHNLIGSRSGDISACDYDRDGDVDLFMIGDDYDINRYAKMYINEGNFCFTELTITSFTGLSFSDSEWADFNNDGFPDLIYCGQLNISSHLKFYKNNGNGTFTETNLSNPISFEGKLSCGDLDNDGDVDLLISGKDGVNNLTKIYKNNGLGIFTVQSGVTYQGFENSNCSLADMDNDGDLDFAINGKNGNNYLMHIYPNYTSSINTAPSKPIGLQYSISKGMIRFKWNKSADIQTSSNSLRYSISIGTIKNSGNLNPAISNLATGYNRIAQLGGITDTFYTYKIPFNIPDSTYLYWSVQAIDASFKGSSFSTIDSLVNPITLKMMKDTIINIFDTAKLYFYTNASNSISFHWFNSNQLNNPNLANPKAFPKQTTKFYVMVSNGNYSAIDSVTVYVNLFSELSNTSIVAVRNSSTDWGDYDKDGDLDLLITGETSGSSNNCISKIYKNNGNSTFTEQTSIVLPCLVNGSGKWGDYNNDGYLDIALVGNSAVKIYKNNGNNTFTLYPIYPNQFYNFIYCTAFWVDCDHDGDLDLLISGKSNSQTSIVVYKNKGNNVFNYFYHTDGVVGTVRIADFDKNGYNEIFYNGLTYGDLVTGIYDSKYNSSNLGITPLYRCSAELGDYDGDGDLDIIATGSTTYNEYAPNPVTKIFRNNGNYTFSSINNLKLTGVCNASVALGDYDNDGDIDLMYSGATFEDTICKLYRNVGNDNFTEELGIKLPQIVNGNINWVDFDKDGDLDIFICGDTRTGRISKIFKNITINNDLPPKAPTGLSIKFLENKILFSWNRSTDKSTKKHAINYNINIGYQPFSCEVASAQSNLVNGFQRNVSFGEIQDTFYILDYPYAFDNNAKTIYWTVQAIDESNHSSTFSSISSALIPVVKQSNIDFFNDVSGSIDWGDYNNDGFLDVLGVGINTYDLSIIYKNNGNNTFTMQTSIDLFGASNGQGKWGDYNNDGLLDILISGSGFTKIYKNNGNNSFSEQISISLPLLQNSLCEWFDIDNDGDLDIFLSGNVGYTNKSYIYINNRNNTFTSLNGLIFSGNSWKDASFGDYNNDGFQDIFLMQNNNSPYASILYKNNGNNTFTSISALSVGITNGCSDWGDYNNDGYLDIIISGVMTNNSPITRIYKNNGNGTFTLQNTQGLPMVYSSDAKWADFNNDGILDLFLAGSTSINNVLSNIFINSGNNVFVPNSDFYFGGSSYPKVTIVDFNNDGVLDIMTNFGFFKRNSHTLNTPPNPPSFLTCQMINDYTAKFTWSKSSDNTTPSNGLNYILRVGTTPFGVDLINSHTNTQNGFRKVVIRGNIQDTSITIYLPNSLGTYFNLYCTVQAEDNGFLVSTPSAVLQKTIKTSNHLLNFNASQTTFTTPPFNPTFTIVSNNLSGYSYKWDFGDGGQLTSTVANVTHQYIYNGQYSVSLIATNIITGIMDTVVKNSYILCNGGSNCIINATIHSPSTLNSCTGDSIRLSCNYDTSFFYQWRLNGLPINNANDSIFYAKQSGNYSVLIYNSNTCNGISSNIQLKFNTSKPIQILTSGNINYCSNDRMKLSVLDNYMNYSWSTGSNSPFIYIKNAGNYTLTVIDSNNCVIVSPTISINASYLLAPDICKVGIDIIKNRNFIEVDKQIGNNIESYFVYREDLQNGNYIKIGNLLYNDSNVFIDNGYLPTIGSISYKISAVDTCGAESQLSSLHKNVFLKIENDGNERWKLSWNPYLGYSYLGFKIYRGTSPQNLNLIDMVSFGQNSYTDNPGFGTFYYRVEVSEQNLCSTNLNTFSNIVETNNVGIQDKNKTDLSLKVYPNPNDGEFYIETNNDVNKSFQLQLYTLTGELVYTKKLNQFLVGEVIKIQVANLASGLYFLKIQVEDVNLFKKIIIK